MFRPSPRSLSTLALTCLTAAVAVMVWPALMPSARAQDTAQDTAQAPPREGAFTIDNVHSSIIFRIKHLDVSYFLGRFNQMSGTMLIDADDPASSFIEITIDTTSIDTNNKNRDEHVRSGDYLSAEQFPTATFKSTSFRKAGDKLQATGDFTLHGVTKEITVDVAFTGQAEGRHGERQGIEVKFDFDRTDYGIGSPGGGLSNEVNMHVAIEAVR